MGLNTLLRYRAACEDKMSNVSVSNSNIQNADVGRYHQKPKNCVASITLPAWTATIYYARWSYGNPKASAAGQEEKSVVTKVIQGGWASAGPVLGQGAGGRWRRRCLMSSCQPGTKFKVHGQQLHKNDSRINLANSVSAYLLPDYHICHTVFIQS